MMPFQDHTEETFDVITNGAGPSMWELVSNTMADVPEFWAFVDGGPGAWTYDQVLAGWTVLAEAEDPDAAKFQNEIRKILGKLEREEKAIAKRTAKIVNDYRNNILANIQWEAVTEWDIHRLSQLDRTMKAASKQFRDQMNDVWKTTANQATALALAGIDDPMQAIGMITKAIPPRLPTQALAVMNEYMPRLIKGISEDTMKRVRNEATMVMTGVKRPAAARAAIGGAIEDLEITTKLGKTYTVRAYTRARNLMRTEFNRVNNLVSTQRIDQLAKDAGQGVGKKWLHRDSHAPRAGHAALNGKVIWPEDGELFNVGGTKVAGPHDPALPASESVNCHCRLVIHVDIAAFKAAYKTPDEREAAKAAAKKKAAKKPEKKPEPKAKPKAKPPAAKIEPVAPGGPLNDTNPDWADDRPTYRIQDDPREFDWVDKEGRRILRAPTPKRSEAARLQLEAAERDFVDKKKEWAAFVDENGDEVLRKTTNNVNKVSFQTDELPLMADRTITHNHPSRKLKYGDFPGASFSEADLEVVFKYHGKGIRAVAHHADGRKIVHIMDIELPDGVYRFRAAQAVLNYQKNQVIKLRKAYQNAVLKGNTTPLGIAHEQIHHEAWLRTNQRFPFLNYRRELVT